MLNSDHSKKQKERGRGRSARLQPRRYYTSQKLPQHWMATCPGAADVACINDGDQAFMVMSTALVFLMTPGLALFYGGLVRQRHALNCMMMVLICVGKYWFISSSSQYLSLSRPSFFSFSLLFRVSVSSSLFVSRFSSSTPKTILAFALIHFIFRLCSDIFHFQPNSIVLYCFSHFSFENKK